MFENGLFIFRRDLRIQDNIALNMAAEQCKHVFPIFIFTPEQITDKNKFKSDNAIQFMIESLDDLQSNIHKHNGNLNTFYGENDVIIKKLIKKWNIDSVFFNRDITPYAKKRDHNIERICKNMNVECITGQDYYLYEPDAVTTGSGDYYSKYTPYYNKVITLKVATPKYTRQFHFTKVLDSNIKINDAYLKFTDPNPNILVNGSRENGLKILNNISKFKTYDKIRNDLDKETTQLSAYLKFGSISVREAYEKMKSKLGIKSGLIKQLIWREFYAQLLFHNPRVLGNPLKEKYDKIKWDKNSKHLRAWKDGMTGFPIVDAGMREMNETGYMHNRARLITASFLIKTLLIDWEDGEKYFSQHLTDYDPASNNGNWQWVASTGADSQPYFRIFNPWSQSDKHDPDAEYIKKWIPELQDVPSNAIHKWDEEWKNYTNIKYPKPIVDYEAQREKALDMYKKVV
jgi:deoxyribodipyrimidine photo-lyase